jgi:hypothetical protein
MNCRKQISLIEPKPDIQRLSREVNSPARKPVHAQRGISAPSAA